MRSKKRKSPLEDALLSKGESGYTRSVELCRWFRDQFREYHGSLGLWRANREKYAAEAQDMFKHREVEYLDARSKLEQSGQKAFFPIRNDSLNLVGSMCEFASAQAEQDLFGGEPWFAAAPVGRADSELADTIQKHLQWSLRDGKLVRSYTNAIPLAAALGEVFTKTSYHIEIDNFEAPRLVLHDGKKPVMFGGKYVGQDDLAQDENGDWVRKDGQPMALAGEPTWEEAYESQQTVISQGVETAVLHHSDLAFREDAPALDLRHTNFYVIVEMTALEAMQRFNLSATDAIRLAKCSTITNAEQFVFSADEMAYDESRLKLGAEPPFGADASEQALNSRVRLVEAYAKLDPLGDGIARRVYAVFPPSHEEWLVHINYLGAFSPKSALPIHCHTWEAVPHRLYGKGFFQKYGPVQRYVDNLFSQIGFRNDMHANPVTGVNPANIEGYEEESNIELTPGLTLVPKANKTLKDIIEFAKLPDLDDRSMELLNLMVSMAQLRSGISSASQGDMASLPENNTATGIRQLMSRAAVLLKKPIRGLRRSFNDQFSYTTTLFYANFDRVEAFTWGEGENVEMMQLSAEQVRNLDIDVRMLLTQEQNQTKLESAQVATGLFQQWIATPEIEKPNARPLYLQAMKALEFDQADTIIREAAPTLADAISLLPEAEQTQALMVMEAGQQALMAAQAAQSPQNVEEMPSQPPIPQQQPPSKLAA